MDLDKRFVEVTKDEGNRGSDIPKRVEIKVDKDVEVKNYNSMAEYVEEMEEEKEENKLNVAKDIEGNKMTAKGLVRGCSLIEYLKRIGRDLGRGEYEYKDIYFLNCHSNDVYIVGKIVDEYNDNNYDMVWIDLKEMYMEYAEERDGDYKAVDRNILDEIYKDLF